MDASCASYNYGVFINHRGPDTKKTFASYLYRRLLVHGFRPFLDHEELKEGLNFPSQIVGAIRSASVHVAIFSPTYAYSQWCLHELVLMLETGAPIIPIFYHVEPAELRWTDQNKKGVYAEALDKLQEKKTVDSQTHEEKSRYDSATLQKWRNALSTVANISGFDLKGKFNGDEGHMLEKIVEQVVYLSKKPGLYVAKYPTGLNDKVTDFETTILKQQQHSGEVQVAGIVGLGGMGKTTLALELFNRKSSKYNKFYFLADVREKANKSSLHSVQRELLRGLTQKDLDINNIYEGKSMIEIYLKSFHVFLILDDIDHEDQLEALLPVKDVLRSDSFILITSRYKDVLERSGVEQLCIYKLTGLPRQHSQELFCSYAFSQTHPLHGFEDLLDRFLEVCDGLPLALKVLGALLFGKPEPYWEAKLYELKVQLKVSPDIKSRLKISYEALSEVERKIFLDIAFFFIGENKASAIAVWNESGWNGLLGLTNLEGKCLVEVDDKNVIYMHDQLRDLGRDIAEEESPRRLWRPTGNIHDWLHKQSYVLTEARGIGLLPEGHSTERVGTSSQKLSWYQRNYQTLGNRAMQFCNRLYDKLDRSLRIGAINLQLVEAKGHLLDRILRVRSPNLIWLSWRDCPYTCIPSWITIKNLRVLKVEGRVLETLWRGKSQAPLQLQELEIIDASRLSSIPKSIGQLKHLERIIIDSSFLARLPEEFGHLNSLRALVLHAGSLKSLPNSLGKLTNLHRMDLSGCEKLVRLPDTFSSFTNLHHIELRGCKKLKRLADSFCSWTNLHHMDLHRCRKLENLPDSFGSLTNLHHMDLSRCEKLERLPDSFGSLTKLHSMNLSRCKELVRLPDSLGSLTNLHHMDLSCCKKLERLPDSFGSLVNLRRMDLSYCKKLERLPDIFGSLTNLCRMDLEWCQKLERLPESFGSLTNLRRMDLSGCEKLESLPDSFGGLTNLHSMVLSKCMKLKRLPDSLGNLTNLRRMDLSCCKKLDRLPDSFGSLINLHSMVLSKCMKLERLPDSLGSLTNLRRMDLRWCEKLQRLPDSFGSLTSLKYFSVSFCSNLTISTETFGNIRTLEHIDLTGCQKVEVWPSQLTQQRSLKTLKLMGTNFKELPNVIELPSHLETLWVGNPVLDMVMPSLGDLRNLKEWGLDSRELQRI